MWSIHHSNVLRSVARPSVGFIRHSFRRHLRVPTRCYSALAAPSTESQVTTDSPLKNKDSLIMSARNWGYQWGYQQPAPHGSFNPAASQFIPQSYQGGSISSQPQDFASINNLPPTSLTPPPRETDSPPYSPPSVVGSQSSRPSSPTDNKSKRARRERRPERKTSRDKINSPSAASGGVPEPSPEYLKQASFLPFQLPYARKILVVIDLNGTLLHRPDRRNPTSFVERPHARVFLRYCINTFKVVIWSSAKPANVSRMCAQLLTPEELSRVVAVWGRDRFGLTNNDYNTRVMCYKRLTTLWNDPIVAASHPDVELGKRWSQADTLLVDDSLEKARSEPYNLIQIPEFIGDAEEEGYILPQVHDYINECARQTDISTYIRNQPFRAVPGWQLLPGPAQ